MPRLFPRPMCPADVSGIFLSDERPPQHVCTAVYKGTVNDPTTFPPPSKSHGSYHWAFERLLSAALVPMTAAAFVTSGSNYPILDGILGVSLVMHSHIGVRPDAIISSSSAEYVHSSTPSSSTTFTNASSPFWDPSCPGDYEQQLLVRLSVFISSTRTISVCSPSVFTSQKALLTRHQGLRSLLPKSGPLSPIVTLYYFSNPRNYEATVDDGRKPMVFQ